MKIQRYPIERMTIEEFAEKHDLIMEIHERTPLNMGKRWHPRYRFYARFKDSGVISGSDLIMACGNGKTEEEAIADYQHYINLETIKVNDKEIQVPELILKEE